MQLADARTFGRRGPRDLTEWASLLPAMVRLEPLLQRSPTTMMQNSPKEHAAGSLSLGQPMDIRSAAALFGCSAWTIRQTLIPRGLPHFRMTSKGKLFFYRDQVIRWIEAQQTQRLLRGLRA